MWEDDVTIVIMNMIVTIKLPLQTTFVNHNVSFDVSAAWTAMVKPGKINSSTFVSCASLLIVPSSWRWADLSVAWCVYSWIWRGYSSKFGHEPYSNWQLEHIQIMFDALNERDVGGKNHHMEFWRSRFCIVFVSVSLRSFCIKFLLSLNTYVCLLSSNLSLRKSRISSQWRSTFSVAISRLTTTFAVPPSWSTSPFPWSVAPNTQITCV